MSDPAFPRAILVDANFLVAYVNLHTSPDDRARIEHLLATAERSRSVIVIPMPAYAEFLVHADIAAIEITSRLERKAFIDMAPFDRTAAFECAQLDRAALGANDKRDGSRQPWQKVKIDRQIIAIGKARGATLVVSGDADVRSNALRVGMSAVKIEELELPASARQTSLDLSTMPSAKR